MKPDITKEDALRMAHNLISSPNYTREVDARAKGWLSLAEKLPSGEGRFSTDTAAQREFRKAIRLECRDLGVGAPTQTTSTSVLAHQGFVDFLLSAQRQVDRLVDPDTVTLVRTPTGVAMVFPFLDDTQQSAIALAESAEDVTGVEGDAAGDPIVNVEIGSAVTYRSKIVRVSTELVADQGFDLAEFLMRSFAIRLDRGIGPVLVTSLMSTAQAGPTVLGDTTQSSPDPTSQIGYHDLVNLRGSIDPAYRRSPKCAFLMNDSTLTAIDALVDKNNRPIVRPAYNAEGERLLLDYPVKICPSFDSIGSGKKPVAFGALDYFIFRLAEKGTDLQIMMERYAEYGQIGYQARLRGNGVLLGVGQDVSSPVTFTSPVKYLQNEA